eukprot:TRINITY_DN33858_c0_g1_i1.p1 TRINITY_DN33858_c0_g1~~TRINITY_DN33858_c0_g1_i1.p1  ORF type:complete len:352 (-),score=72.18 TRINITY_DN33858_c0_g1_i1:141-1196(-)
MVAISANPPANYAGLPTPEKIKATLVEAFGAEQIGETGYNISAAACCSEKEKEAAREAGTSLLYGELLPDGVSKALSPQHLGGALLENTNRAVLELGMGSGKVAIQTFLQCPNVKRVLGIELVESRFALAEIALHKLVSNRPDDFEVKAVSSGKLLRVEEKKTSRLLEFRCADFFTLGLDLTGQSDAIWFAVNIPCKLFPKLCERLATAKTGCRIFSYHSLDSIWWADIKCPFHQVEANVPASDTFSTSWSPQGYRFYVYECDHDKPQSLRLPLRNETFSEWQILAAENGESYFHNQETEVSQWEIPQFAGCWRVYHSEEWSAPYYCHVPSGHTQWEVPKCLGDLGWTTSE